jgi:preprotein translocase SecE subunit
MRITKACGLFLLEDPLAAALPLDMNAFFTYLRNVRAEMAHVVWPDRTQAIMHTILIIVISAVLALLISGLDYLFTGVVARLVG